MPRRGKLSRKSQSECVEIIRLMRKTIKEKEKEVRQLKQAVNTQNMLEQIRKDSKKQVKSSRKRKRKRSHLKSHQNNFERGEVIKHLQQIIVEKDKCLSNKMTEIDDLTMKKEELSHRLKYIHGFVMTELRENDKMLADINETINVLHGMQVGAKQNENMPGKNNDRKRRRNRRNSNRRNNRRKKENEKVKLQSKLQTGTENHAKKRRKRKRRKRV